MRSIAASTLGDSFQGEYERIADVEVAHTKLDGGWLILTCDWDSVHVVPVLDKVLHAVDSTDECVCVPEVVQDGDGWIVSHSSLDGREATEPD